MNGAFKVNIALHNKSPDWRGHKCKYETQWHSRAFRVGADRCSSLVPHLELMKTLTAIFVQGLSHVYFKYGWLYCYVFNTAQISPPVFVFLDQMSQQGIDCVSSMVYLGVNGNTWSMLEVLQLLLTLSVNSIA